MSQRSFCRKKVSNPRSYFLAFGPLGCNQLNCVQHEAVFCVAIWKTAEKMPRADRSRRKSSMQLTVVAESESRIQIHCPWHRVDRRTAKIWPESLASWLCMTVECTVYSGPSHTSCLLRCWSLALICQRLSVIEIPLVTLMANQMLGKPVTPELATTIFRDISFTKTTRWPVGCPLLQIFDFILW